METQGINVPEARKRVLGEVHKVVIGQEEPLDLMLLAMLCGGHCLLKGVPGVGKTLMASTLAKVLQLDFNRVQFTPDMMPADITGGEVLEEDNGKWNRRFLPGPVFTNFLLADEINRTPPKTQAALLQAMQERQVSVGNTTYPLEEPFLVVATQNPIEMEGTYALPEAQLDRFLFNIEVTYPTEEEELGIVKGQTGNEAGEPVPVLGPGQIMELRKQVRGVPMADDVSRLAVRLAAATRPGGKETPDIVNEFVEVGASPRASLTLALGAKAKALVAGKTHVDFADIKSLALPVLRHRLVMNFRSRAEKVSVEKVIEEVVASLK
ncbi:MAG: AAA family ATPase [Roseibacillus sp.]